MVRKHIGHYISKGKCLKVYAKKVMNKRTGRTKVVRVNSKGKKVPKGTKVYKRRSECLKALKMKKSRKSHKTRKHSRHSHSSRRSHRSRRSRFGKESCYYSVPYFGGFVPSIGKTWSGTENTGITSSAWNWPQPLAYKLDTQQGGWKNFKN